MTRAELVAAIVNRCRISGSDPAATGVPGDLNLALGDWDQGLANGWPWLRRVYSIALTESVTDYTFADVATLSGESPEPVITKIVDLTLELDDGRVQLERRPLHWMRRQYGAISRDIPQCWDAVGTTLYVYPPAADDYDAAVTVVIGEPPLTTDDQEPLAPAVFHNAIVQYACYLTYLGLNQLDNAEVARKQYEQMLTRARAAARQYVGPGYSFAEPR